MTGTVPGPGDGATAAALRSPGPDREENPVRDIRRNMISGGFFLLVSILYFSGTFSFIEISRYSKESKLLPRVYAVMLFLAALRILTKAIAAWTREKKRQAEAGGESAAAAGPAPNYAKVAATLILIAIYAYLFQWMGFVSATFIYLVAHMLVLAGKRTGGVRRIVIVSALTSLCLYYLFVHIFQIAFPYGVLF